jgi:hypothetical protein
MYMAGGQGDLIHLSPRTLLLRISITPQNKHPPRMLYGQHDPSQPPPSSTTTADHRLLPPLRSILGDLGLSSPVTRY